MCRLFGMHAGVVASPATFWLIDAPDSLAAQSHRNPDGAGIGAFDEVGVPQLSKQPLAAWQDMQFAAEAHELTGTTFVAHVRYATSGGHTMANTHPFLQDGRLFAHNGVVGGLAQLDARLADLDASELVAGDTDSERVFALITAEVARHRGDVRAGIVAALEWIGETLPVYAVNFVLSTASDLWALRWPATHELFVLQRPAGGTDTHEDLDLTTNRIHAHSPHLADHPAVVVASEQMDDDAAWRALASGELLHVSSELAVDSSFPVPVPRHLLQLTDLEPQAAQSQQPTSRTAGDPAQS